MKAQRRKRIRRSEVGACPPSVWRGQKVGGRSLPAVSLAGSEGSDVGAGLCACPIQESEVRR